jgi:hypothetical protein
MNLGVITDGISRDLNHALKVAREFDLDYAELQYVWDKEIGDHSSSEMSEIKVLLNNYGIAFLVQGNYSGASNFFNNAKSKVESKGLIFETEILDFHLGIAAIGISNRKNSKNPAGAHNKTFVGNTLLFDKKKPDGLFMPPYFCNDIDLAMLQSKLFVTRCENPMKILK